MSEPRIGGAVAGLIAAFGIMGGCLASCSDVHSGQSGPLQDNLTQAIRDGDLEAVRRLVSSGADVNGTDSKGETPLVLAAGRGDAEIVLFLLTKGAEPNRSGNLGRSPLEAAVSVECEEIVKVLLGAGAKPDGGGRGPGPLHIACMRGNAGIAYLLIERGADVNRQDDMKRSPLLYASRGGHAAVVSLLLKRGAITSLEARDMAGWTPLHAAAAERRKEVMAILVKSGARAESPVLSAAINDDLGALRRALEDNRELVKYMDGAGWTALHWAVVLGHHEVARYLLGEGADPMSRRKSRGWTPLCYACAGGDATMARILLDGGAKLLKDDPDYQLYLLFAAGRKTPELVRLLLENGGYPNSRDEATGATCLHLAASEGDKASAEILLDHGAVIDATDRAGSTPLSIAIRLKRVGVVRLLLDRGADWRLTEWAGGTPLEWAQEVAPELVPVLRARMESHPEPRTSTLPTN